MELGQKPIASIAVFNTMLVKHDVKLVRPTENQGLEGVLLQGGAQQGGGVAQKAGEGGGCCGPDIVILGALPDGDQVGDHFAAGKALGPWPCLAADVFDGLHSVVLHGRHHPALKSET